MKKRLLTILLTLMLVFTTYPVLASAEDVSNTQTSAQSVTYYTTASEIVPDIQKGIEQRQENICIYYQTTETLTEETIDEWFELAFAETDKSTQGDALRLSCLGYAARWSYSIRPDVIYYTINFSMQYTDTAEQEAHLEEEIKTVLDSFEFTEDTSDYTKIKTIYDYICGNISYDYANLEDDDYTLKYSAYAALINKKAVCQGYAVLLYRMLKEVGLECRCITGTADGGGHAWNIVKLGDCWYNLDSTWDATRKQYRLEYEYFMTGESFFKDHVCDEAYTTDPFTEAHPMSTEDYSVCEDPSAHDYVKKNRTEPTCTEAGYIIYICSLCQDTKKEPIPALGHDYRENITEPTCTTDGYTTHTCSRCENSYVDATIAATGHSWDNGKVTTAATCTEDGVKTYTCTACDDTKTETIEKLGHDYVAVVTAPTCTAEGYTTHTCSRCENSYVDTTIAATGHSWDNGKVTTAATCTEDGTKTYTCQNCGETQTETIEKLGHDYVAVVTEPTCTAEGYTTHTCSRCGRYYMDETVVATGHNWDDGVVTKPDTTSETGILTYTCANCGETKTEEIDHQRIPGDINGDGKVDTNDLVRLMKMISENAQHTYLDINGDKKVDTNDLIRLMKYLTDKTVEIH